jgi:hypothetical protein
MTDIMLDRSLYFSTCHGEITDNVFYRQGGLPFDGAGHLVEKALDEAAKKVVAKKRAELAKKPAEEGETTGKVDPADVNLEQWLRREVKYPFHVIANVMRERYHKQFANFGQVVDFLVFEQKLLPEDKVAKDLLDMVTSNGGE